MSGKRVILTVSRLAPRKGHDQVIRVLPAILQRYPNLVYVFTGDGEERTRLHNLARECGVDHAMRMVGTVTFEKVQKLYKRCEVFVMPSRQEGLDVEGFGICFLEAGLFAKPVLAGNSGGVSDAVEDGVTGLLADPYDTEDIKEKLETLLQNEALSAQLGRQGRERVLREFSLARQSEQLKGILV